MSKGAETKSAAEILYGKARAATGALNSDEALEWAKEPDKIRLATKKTVFDITRIFTNEDRSGRYDPQWITVVRIKGLENPLAIPLGRNSYRDSFFANLKNAIEAEPETGIGWTLVQVDFKGNGVWEIIPASLRATHKGVIDPPRLSRLSRDNGANKAQDEDVPF